NLVLNTIASHYPQLPSRIDLLVSANRAMNVSVTVSREKERAYMKTFTIDNDNNITADRDPCAQIKLNRTTTPYVFVLGYGGGSASELNSGINAAWGLA